MLTSNKEINTFLWEEESNKYQNNRYFSVGLVTSSEFFNTFRRGSGTSGEIIISVFLSINSRINEVIVAFFSNGAHHWGVGKISGRAVAHCRPSITQEQRLLHGWSDFSTESGRVFLSGRAVPRKLLHLNCCRWSKFLHSWPLKTILKGHFKVHYEFRPQKMSKTVWKECWKIIML